MELTPTFLERPSSKGWVAGAHDHGEVDFVSAFGDAFVEATLGFAAHEVVETRGDALRRERFSVGLEGEGGGVGFGFFSFFVEIKASARFFSEFVFSDQNVKSFGDADAVGKGVGESSRDVRGDVEANFIEEAQRSHRHAEIDHRLIDGFGFDAAQEKFGRFEKIGQKDAVDDEAGAVVGENGEFSDFLGEGEGAVESFDASFGGADDFDQGHARDGIEKMKAEEAFGIFDVQGELVDRQRGGVGGQKGVGASAATEIGEDFLFDFEVFDGGFDDEVAGF